MLNVTAPVHEKQRANAVNLVSGDVGDSQTDVGCCSQALYPAEDDFIAGLYGELLNLLVIAGALLAFFQLLTRYRSHKQ